MKKIFYLLVMSAISILMSCRADFNWEETRLTKAEIEYNKNFRSYYEVPKDMSWDFSNNGYSLNVGTRADGITVTAVSGINYNINRWGNMTSNKALYDGVSEILPDGKEHKGETAILAAPSNSFTIYPLTAQGLYTYDMYVKVGNENAVKVFTKNWTDYNKPYANGMTANNKKVVMDGVVINALVGTPIQVYITNIKNGNTTVTTKQLGTGSGNAIVVDANVVPEGLPTDIMTDESVIKFVGIEDTPDLGDKDYNDLVIMIIGNPYTPEPIIITDDEYTIPTQLSKRYMVEDLGTTDDFDFNDIVFDLIQNRYEHHKITKDQYGNIRTDNIDNVSFKQYCIVRALGGTRDFDLYIDDVKVWTKSKPTNLTDRYRYIRFNEMYNTNYTPLDYNPNDSITHTFEVEGWIPNENNITFRVYPSGEESDPNDYYDPSVSEYVVKFPVNGAIPYIIAFDTKQAWNYERVNIFDDVNVGNFIHAENW